MTEDKYVWLCTHCWEQSPEPEMKLLDGTYGSQRCHSLRCKHEKRIFHREVNHDGQLHPTGGERSPEQA